MKAKAEITQRSPPNAKIALFRSFFRGREDLYPRQFESQKTGRTGYSPACGNEWIRGICEKPKIKCSECRHRRFLPLVDDVVRWHLCGQDDSGKEFVMGIYPMLLNETCFFLTADFDKPSWEQDARAFIKTCQQLGLPAALERSRSGKGARVWLFFAEAIPAILARKLGCHILTETMEYDPDIGLDSYDRLFPNQNTLPQGGFKNAVALPLQKRARNLGNSLFVSDCFIAFEDQWAFLSSLGKVARQAVETIVQRAEARGRIMGMHLRVSEEEEITSWNIGLPRGCLEDLCRLLSDLKMKVVIREELQAGQPLAANFLGELQPEQQTAAAAMLKTDIGVLAATTAFGKTVIAAWLISKRKKIR